MHHSEKITAGFICEANHRQHLPISLADVTSQKKVHVDIAHTIVSSNPTETKYAPEDEISICRHVCRVSKMLSLVG